MRDTRTEQGRYGTGERQPSSPSAGRAVRALQAPGPCGTRTRLSAPRRLEARRSHRYTNWLVQPLQRVLPHTPLHFWGIQVFNDTSIFSPEEDHLFAYSLPKGIWIF